MNIRSLVSALLSEVDGDIRDIMSADSDNKGYKVWELLNDPVISIISWQMMRNASKSTKQKKRSR